MVINRITAFLLFFIYLSGSISYSLPLVSDIESCMNQSWATPCAEPLTLQDETFTNEAPIVATVSTCYWTEETLLDFHYIGTETQEGQINIFFFEKADVLHFSTGYEFHVCDKRTVHLDPVASGNYTLNYYLIDETSLDRSEWSTRLQDSKSIVVEKTVDNEPPTGRVLIAGDAIEDQTLTLETTDAIHDADGFEGFSYRWIRHYGISEESGLEVGTDSDSYDLTKDDVRQMVSVIVTQKLGPSVVLCSSRRS
jgi:hypothetical protein